mmetsp:Transcript_9257/g.17435  ORF Transcript_9257/g.17435 Transcript_9257/m.17435 type:complete len:135 (+) Transcript_9257:325-729(+)
MIPNSSRRYTISRLLVCVHRQHSRTSKSYHDGVSRSHQFFNYDFANSSKMMFSDTATRERSFICSIGDQIYGGKYNHTGNNNMEDYQHSGRVRRQFATLLLLLLRELIPLRLRQDLSKSWVCNKLLLARSMQVR